MRAGVWIDNKSHYPSVSSTGGRACWDCTCVWASDDDQFRTFSACKVRQWRYFAKYIFYRIFYGILNAVPLGAVQCEQTTVWATLRVMCREEVGQSLQGQVRFVSRRRLQHGNNLVCSSGAFSARWRGLGIFAVAQLTLFPNKHMHMLFDPIWDA
jgi:hypothetical protein